MVRSSSTAELIEGKLRLMGAIGIKNFVSQSMTARITTNSSYPSSQTISGRT